MAERRPPRAMFGFGPTPLPGSENPMLSQNMSQRFTNAGLGSYVPYLNPWETVVQAQNYRQFERDLGRNEQIASAEDRFMQAIQEDPQTGYEKFIAQNPISVMSPMVRAYAIQRDRMRTEPKQDRLAMEAAQMGAPYLSTYEKGKGSNPIGAYAEAVSQYNRDKAEAKKRSAPDDRLLLSGDPRDEFDTIMSELATARSAEPTDKEKEAFLDPARKGRDGQWSPEDWTSAYHKAKQQKVSDAITKLDNFQRVYGEMYKVPQVQGRGAPSVEREPAMASAAPSPWDNRTSVGPQAQPLTVPQPIVPPVVSETVTETPTAVTETVREQAPAQTIPTISKGASTPVEKVATVAGNLLGNVKENMAFDPLESAAALTRPGGLQEMMLSAPPSQDQQNQEWTSAKQKVRDFIKNLPGTPEEKAGYLGSMFKEETVPQDFFTKKKMNGEKAYISAASALADAMREADPSLSRTALKDKGGRHDWNEVARIAAMEELENMGYITRSKQPNQNAPQAKSPNIKSITKIN